MEFNTALLHKNFSGDKASGSTMTPIYQVSAFSHSSAEQLEKVFNNKAPGYAYSRIGNPTVTSFAVSYTHLDVYKRQKTGSAISERLKEISHTETMLEFETERQIPKLLNADCGMPVGAFSKVTNGKIELIISTDCKKTISGSADIKDRFNLAKRLVSEL